jgi:hypothetical protein
VTLTADVKDGGDYLLTVFGSVAGTRSFQVSRRRRGGDGTGDG